MAHVNRKYPLLDFARAFAALSVACLHLVGGVTQAENRSTQFFRGADISHAHYDTIPFFYFQGNIGVEIFFLISGYIISISAARSPTAGDFIKSRVLRIVPTLWICTLMSASILLLFHVGSDRSILERTARSMLLIPIGPHVDGVIWTIFLEIIFYAIVAIWLSWFKADKLLYLGYALIWISFAFWLARGSELWETDRYHIEFWSFHLGVRHAIYFGVGLVVSQFPRSKNVGFAQIVLVIAVLTAYLEIKWANGFEYQGYKEHGASNNPALPYSAWLLSLGLIFANEIINRRGIALADYSIVRKIGIMTYPFYLLHNVLGSLAYAVMERFGSFPIYANLFVALAFVIAVSFLISEFLEPMVKGAMRLPVACAVGALQRRYHSLVYDS